MHQPLKIYHLILIFGFSISLEAQFSRDFKQVDIVVDGIKSGRVTDFETDHEGYLWITCFQGLLRYDGYTFERFSHDPNNDRSLPNTYVEVLHVDKKGELWVGTDSGLARYNQDSQDFDRFSSDSVGAPSGFIVDITEGPDSMLWIAEQEGGLYSFNPESGVFSRHLNEGHSASIANDKVRVLLADRQGSIWIGLGFGLQEGKHGLIKYDPVLGTAKRYQSDLQNEKSLLDDRVSALMQDNLDRIFIGTYKNGLHLYDTNHDNFIRLKSNHPLATLYPPEIDSEIWGTDPFVNILTQDRKGGYWIGTIGAGLHYFSSLTEDPLVYRSNTNGRNGLLTNLLWTLYEDPFDVVWVGDVGGVGLHKLDPTTPLFKRLTAPSTFRYEAMSVTEDEELLFADRDNRIYMYDINNQWSQIDLSQEDFKLHDIQSDHSTGHIWLAGTGDSLQVMLIRKSIKNFSRKVYRANGKLESEDQQIDLTIGHNGKLWLAVGTSQLQIFDPKKLSFEMKNVSAGKSAKIHETFQLAETTWATDIANNNLLKYDDSTDSFEIELEGYKVHSILRMDSILFFGTKKGILLRRNEAGEISQISISEGSIQPEITMLYSDSENRLWIGTGNGLYLMDESTSSPRSIGLRDFIFTGSTAKIENKIYTLTDKGIITFNPNSSKGNKSPPIVHISGMDVQGDQVPLSNNASEELSFQYDENNITFSYVGLHFSDPLQNKYKYRLTPFDDDWIMADNDRSVRYTNIPPGQYHFELMASNSSGIWTSNPATLSFEIRSPWWLQWWALISFFVILGVTSLSIYYLLINRKLQHVERKRLLELNEFKTRLYANITHEFRTPLTVIMGLADNLQSHFQHKDRHHAKSASMIYDNGEHLLHLVNKMLDFSKLQDDSMTLDLTIADIVPLIKNTVQGFHPLAREKDIILQLNDEIGHLEMEFDAQKIAIILSNLISNALKFTPTYGMVKVRIFKQMNDSSQDFCLSVIDNGIGIPSQDIPKIFDRYFQSENHHVHQVKGSGIGLSLTRDLVELMNGKIEADQSDLGGMEFILTLPIASKAKKIARNAPHGKIMEEVEEIANSLPSILLIEDNYDIAHYISTCLDHKFQILHEANGDRGLETAFERLPDLVITDLMLPGLQGFEVLTSLKIDPRTDHIPIIILTAKVAMNDRLEGLQLGADAYLTKPFDKEELLIRIERLLEMRQKLQKKYRSHLLSSTIEVDPGSKEDHFILKAEKIILENLQEEEFSGNVLASKMHLSRSQFHRKIKALTGMSASIYIRHVRLQQALTLLKNPESTISEIAYQVGFKSPVYFSQVFREKFDLTPSEMQESISKYT